MKTRIRQVVKYAFGKEKEVARENSTGFWADKTPCWQMCHCSPDMRESCPATEYTFLPCWEIEGTYCKLQTNGPIAVGTDTSICKVCRVHKKSGAHKPIELKLFARGLSTSFSPGFEPIIEAAGGK